MKFPKKPMKTNSYLHGNALVSFSKNPLNLPDFWPIHTHAKLALDERPLTMKKTNAVPLGHARHALMMFALLFATLCMFTQIIRAFL